MSRGRPRKPVQPEIAELGKQIQLWRQTRQKRSPMPEELWREATRLAQSHGVSPVCRHLKLGYQRLQKRVEACEAEPPKGPPAITAAATAPTGFVELSAAQLLEGTAAPSSQQTVIELSEPEGTRLTVRLAAGQPLDVLGLIQGLRGAGR
jgi:hypothetical protein